MLELTRIEFLDLLRRSGVGFHAELDDEDFERLRRKLKLRTAEQQSRLDQIVWAAPGRMSGTFVSEALS